MKAGLAAAEAALRVHNVCTAESAVQCQMAQGFESYGMWCGFPYDRRFAASLGPLFSESVPRRGHGCDRTLDLRSGA